MVFIDLTTILEKRLHKDPSPLLILPFIVESPPMPRVRNNRGSRALDDLDNQ